MGPADDEAAADEAAGRDEPGLKKWRVDYSKASWSPPVAPRCSYCRRKCLPVRHCRPVAHRKALVRYSAFLFATATAVAVGAIAGLFDGDELPPPPPPPPPPPGPPVPPPVPGEPRAAVLPSLPGAVTVSWGAVGGAVGYYVEEWNWNRLDDRGWYSQRALEDDDADGFMFRLGYGGIELPRCGTVVAVPHASLRVAGRAGLSLEWRVRSVGPTGAPSAWSGASNAVDMPLSRGDALSNNCEQCSAGHYDHDGDAETLCQQCGDGTFAALGAVSCTPCDAGLADLDLDASTPCEPCPIASFSTGTACAVCASGRSDHDRDPGTPCTRCPDGTHSQANATICVGCPAGLKDWDNNPSTVCTTCPSCRSGECPLGTAVSGAGDNITCPACTGAFVDHDSNPLTSCQACSHGTESSLTQFGAVGCNVCAAGKTDDDRNASTQCFDCQAGRYSSAGSFGNCSDCPAGFSSDAGATSSADSCFRVNILDLVEPWMIVALIGVAGVVAAVILVPILVLLCRRLCSSARALVVDTTGRRQHANLKPTLEGRLANRWNHQMKVHNYDAGGGTDPAVVPKPSSWVQDMLIIMKRVDGVSAEAKITEDVPQHPRPSAMPNRNNADNNAVAPEPPMSAETSKQVAQVLTVWEAQYSGAVTGLDRKNVALNVAAGRQKKVERRPEITIRSLHEEGALSYKAKRGASKPRFAKRATNAQHQTHIFKAALHASRAVNAWQPTTKPRAATRPPTTLPALQPKITEEVPHLRPSAIAKRNNADDAARDQNGSIDHTASAAAAPARAAPALALAPVMSAETSNQVPPGAMPNRSNKVNAAAPHQNGGNYTASAAAPAEAASAPAPAPAMSRETSKQVAPGVMHNRSSNVDYAAQDQNGDYAAFAAAPAPAAMSRETSKQVAPVLTIREARHSGAATVKRAPKLLPLTASAPRFGALNKALRQEAKAELDSWAATEEVADGDHLDQPAMEWLASINMHHWGQTFATIGTTINDLKQLHPPGDLLALGMADAELRHMHTELIRLRTHG